MAMAPHNLCIIITAVAFVSVCHGLSNRCHPQESQALLSFQASFNGSRPLSWMNGTDCCTMWHGISCDIRTNHVISVSVVSHYTVHFGGMLSDTLCHLPFLRELTLKGVAGITTIPSCLRNLQSLHLNFNESREVIPPTICQLTSLTDLDLSRNGFNGNIPSCLGNLSSLTHLVLAFNQLSGRIPDSLGSLSSLHALYLDGNQLSGNIPDSLGNLSLLKYLSLSNNKLSGTIPSSFAQLFSLTSFSSTGNAFNESIPSSPFPSSIIDLSLSLNYESISETFFHNLTEMRHLYLSNCILNISSTWIPSFQLESLNLISCKIDDQIPAWISTQFSINSLELVNNSLVGEIPYWLWDTSPFLNYVNLSRNNLEGRLFSNTSTWMRLSILDVSGNALTGHMPSIWPPKLTALVLKDNLFSGNIPPSLGSLSQLRLLNLGNNNFSGIIPPSLANCSRLQVLNLGNNGLEGTLPQEFGKLSWLYSLVVRSNKLEGPFPLSIANCLELQVLDIGNNSFEGQIPELVGNISKLRVLVMEGNNFKGSIPSEIGQLTDLHILHLSSNFISGFIPKTILYFEAMSKVTQDGSVLSNEDASYYESDLYYQDGLDMISKSIDEQNPYILSTLTSIDLSNNQLDGEVPSDLGKLKGLMFLNLSMNNLQGTIPSSLGELNQLESLDLSENRFSGTIPEDLKYLSYLGSFNLSNNNLSGSIPQGQQMNTFDESSFLGNPNLWGCPLPKNCSWPKFASHAPPLTKKEVKGKKISWYGIAVGLSYGA
ncbi:hypothetical protein KI387_032446, partial [Taxus chinensis]